MHHAASLDGKDNLKPCTRQFIIDAAWTVCSCSHCHGLLYSGNHKENAMHLENGNAIWNEMSIIDKVKLRTETTMLSTDI